MNLFNTDVKVEEEVDTLGGGSFTWDTGLYDVVVDSVYMDQSSGGAWNLNFVFKTADGKTLNSTQYVTSGTAKGTRNYYETKDGKKKYLPGFVTANDIAVCATGKELKDLEPENKIVEIYDFDLKKKVPTEKPVFMDIIGKPLKLGVHKVKEYKNVKNDAGEYVPSADIKEFNEISKAFTVDGFTTVELKAGATEAEFITKWVEKNTKDFVKDKTKGVTPVGAASAGTAGMPAAGATGAAPSLFNK